MIVGYIVLRNAFPQARTPFRDPNTKRVRQSLRDGARASLFATRRRAQRAIVNGRRKLDVESLFPEPTVSVWSIVPIVRKD